VIARTQEQHRRVLARLSYTLQHRPAVQTRQHHVQNGQIVAFGQCVMQAVLSVAHQVDDKAGLDQTLLQVVAGFGFVLDDKNFHGRHCALSDC